LISWLLLVLFGLGSMTGIFVRCGSGMGLGVRLLSGRWRGMRLEWGFLGWLLVFMPLFRWLLGFPRSSLLGRLWGGGLACTVWVVIGFGVGVLSLFWGLGI
jgi:hypothetical protein